MFEASSSKSHAPSHTNSENKLYTRRHLRRLKKKEYEKEYKKQKLSLACKNTDINNMGENAIPEAQTQIRQKTLPYAVTSKGDQETQHYCDAFFQSASTEQLLKNNDQTMVFNESKKQLILKEQLTNWLISYKISQNAANSLLKILKEYGLDCLPNDCRTLLKTDAPVEIVAMFPGNYHHFGVESGIKYILKLNNISVYSSDIVKIDVNIDGLPLTHSSNSHFWPILGCIDDSNLRVNPPFEIGIYHGSKKPDSPETFLKPFVDELKSLENEGFIFNNKKFKVNVSKILCDAPAKAFALGVKGHNSYFGCTKCTTEGDFYKGRVIYPELDAPSRRHEKFFNGEYEDFVIKKTPLADINVDFVKSVPLDYMHLCCLGVMKRLLQIWLKGSREVRIADENVVHINSILQDIRKFLPVEFKRKPRPLAEVDRWKATELRTFLLYTGPIALENYLQSILYKHFLSFHIAIRILATESLCQNQTYNEYAKQLLRYFIENYGDIYGREYLTHNVHNLVHLPDDVLLHGCLDKFSCFKYENHMHVIKMKLKTCNYPLKQIVKRVNECRVHGSNKVSLNNEEVTEREGEHIGSNVYYNWILYNNLKMDTSERNQHFILNDGTYVKILKIFSKVNNRDKKFVLCEQYELDSMFCDPCDSSILSYWRVCENENRGNVTILPVESITNKCVRYRNCLLSMIHEN